MPFQIQTSETNRRQHSVHLDERAIHRLLAKAVADQLGLDLDASNVRYRVVIETPAAGSLSGDFNRKAASVTVTEDFGPAGA